MRRPKTILLREFFAAMTNHWTIFLFVLFFPEISSITGPELICWILLGMFPVVLFVARELVQSFLLMIMSFVVFFGIITLFPMDSAYFKSYYQMTAIFYLAMSTIRFFRRKGSFTYPIHPVFPMAVNFIFAMIALVTTHTYVAFYSYLSVVISSMSYFMAFYVDQYFHFTSINDETSSNMPDKKILITGMGAATKYLSILILPLTIIVSTTISDEFFHRVLNKFNEIARIILRFLGKILFREKVNEIMSDGTESEMADNFFLTQPNPSIFWQILEKIIFALAIMAVAFFLIRIGIKIFKFLFAAFAKHPYVVSDEEEEIIDVREKINIEKVVSDEEDNPNDSITVRIRKLYRKKAIASALSTSELYRTTAREFSVMEKNPDLADIYEKARYSTVSCTKEDLKQMQLAYRRKNKSAQ